MSRWRYFDESEFDSPDMKGSGRHIDPILVDKLDFIRHDCGFPIHVNSGIRSIAHNFEVGGKENSEHLIQPDGLGHAADIRCTESWKRYEIIRLAFKYGIFRIGIGDSFLHLGNSQAHPQYTVWVY